MRRKLKNRVAAQTARDRKKAKMDTMEMTLAELQAQNKRLMEENNTLRQQSTKLVQENNQLKERLGQKADGVPIKKELESESAALGVSLQKEQIQALFQSTTRYVAFLLTLSLMTSSSCWTASPSKTEESYPAMPLDLSKKRPPQEPPKVQWWGPHQQNWTPSMN